MRILKVAMNGIKYVAKDATRGPVALKNAVSQSNQLAKKFNTIFPHQNYKKRTQVRLESMRRSLAQDKELRKSLKDPGQIGSLVGLFTPIPGGQPLGYILGKMCRYVCNLVL